MADVENRVVVVRVWRDSGRLVIRVLSSDDTESPDRGWVFTDVRAATERVCRLLEEMKE